MYRDMVKRSFMQLFHRVGTLKWKEMLSSLTRVVDGDTEEADFNDLAKLLHKHFKYRLTDFKRNQLLNTNGRPVSDNKVVVNVKFLFEMQEAADVDLDFEKAISAQKQLERTKTILEEPVK